MNGLPPVRNAANADSGRPSSLAPDHTSAAAARRRPNPVRRIVIGLLSLGLAGVAVVGPTAASVASAANVCTSMTAPVYYQINPSSAASLLTRSQSEAGNAASRYGFTTSKGVLFKAASNAVSGLVGVHRLYKRGDFFWTADAAEITAAKKAGYADQGVNFYARTAGADICSVKVQRWVKAGKHQVSVNASGSDALTSAGWKTEGAPFYVASAGSTGSTGSSGSTGSYSTPPLTGTGASDTDGVFSIAVLPDTQQEVFGSDTRFADRNKWLVANRKRLDLRFETQVGDLVNWDTPTHDQYVHASAAMKVSENAGLPWSPTIGNHDGSATCKGGGACPHTDVRVGLRNTATFNQYFPPSRFRAMKGTFEAGKVDNSYSQFSAEGRTWIVMNLELWPRTSVLTWADKIIRANPKANVILVTHAYLNANSTIGTSKDYGQNAPKAIYDTLVAHNANVKLVLSGHVGSYGSRVDSRSGNPVVSFLQTFHDAHNNPTRLLTVNTKTGSVRGQVYYQRTNTYLAGADKTYSGIKWVN